MSLRQSFKTAFSRNSDGGKSDDGSRPSKLSWLKGGFSRKSGNPQRDPSGQTTQLSTNASQERTGESSVKQSIPGSNNGAFTIPSSTDDVPTAAEFTYMDGCQAEKLRLKYWDTVDPKNPENRHKEQPFGGVIRIYPCPYPENKSIHANTAYARLLYSGNKIGEPQGDKQRWYLGAEVDILGTAWPDAKLPKPVTDIFPKHQSREECLRKLSDQFDEQMEWKEMEEHLKRYQRFLVPYWASQQAAYEKEFKAEGDRKNKKKSDLDTEHEETP